MATPGDRSRYFPAIEQRHGHPIEHWWGLLAALDSDRYPDQMALLHEGHGLSRTHANAVVMSYRGSPSSQRFASPADYFDSLSPSHREQARDILAGLQKRFPQLALVMAWNQPILRVPDDYVFGVSASAGHLSINPFSTEVLDAVAPDWEGCDVLGHTIRIPLGAEVDPERLDDMVTRRLAEIAQD